MNLEMCNECLQYGILDEYGVCAKCQLKDVESEG